MFNINAWELGVIAIVAMLLLGPDRLPEYAAGLARLIRRGRDFARGAREQVRSEMGPEFDEIDWQKYDPRRYHPRAIVRNALSDTFADGDDEDEPAPARTASTRGTGATTGNGRGPAGRVNGRSAAGGGTGAGPVTGASLRGAPRPARTPRPPAVRDSPRRSPEPTTWEDAARRVSGGGGVDADAT